MRTLLQAEELERRDMLNALSSSPPVPSAQFATGNFAVRRGAAAPFVDDNDSHTTAVTPGRVAGPQDDAHRQQGQCDVQARAREEGVSATPAFRTRVTADTGAPAASAVQATGAAPAADARTGTVGDGVLTAATIDLLFGVQAVGVAEVVNSPPAARPEAITVSLVETPSPPVGAETVAAPEVADGNGVVETPPVLAVAATAPPDRANPLAQARPESLLANPNLLPAAARPAALARLLPPDFPPPLEPSLPEGQPPPASAAPAPNAPVQQRSEQRPRRWLPRPGDLLPVLPPVDLRALEHALRGFLEELARAGENLAGPEQGRGLWPWIVAVGAAALGLEIARRQLRARAGMPADDIPWSPCDSPGRPHEESSP